MTSIKRVTLSGCHPSPPIASKGCLHFYHIILRLALASIGGEEVGRQPVEDDMVENGWVSKKGEALKWIPFFPRLPLCGDLLIVQTCLQREIWKNCVGSWVGEKGWRLRQLWTDGLQDWIGQGHFIQTLHSRALSYDWGIALGKAKWVHW